MQIGYSWLRKPVEGFSKQLMIVAGLIALPITITLDRVAVAKPLPAPPSPEAAPAVKPDVRTERLTAFLSKLHCPVASLAKDFVEAADDNSLDWRLLPSIAVIESGGGKAARNNNIFGWDNGNQFFPTLRAGINQVAFKLGQSALYRNRDSAGKLRIYNPDENYVRTVLEVMNKISPVVNLEPVERPIRRHNEFVYAAN
jgi:hypothetical protein